MNFEFSSFANMKHFIATFFTLFCVIHFSNGATLNEVKLFNTVSKLSSDPGVQSTKGYHDNSPAYTFNSRTSDLVASQQAMVDAGKLIYESYDFVVSAYTKVDKGAIYSNNPIVSINSYDGNHVLFLVAIKNDDRRKLSVEFSLFSGNSLRTVPFLNTRREIRLDEWHKVELRVQNASRMIKILVDDRLVHVQLFEYAFDKLPSNSQLRLAQTYLPAAEGLPMITSRFQGSLQDVKIYFGTKECKTVPKPCKCPVPGGNQCIMNGVEYKEGDQWQKDNCTRSLCRQNRIINVYICQTCNEGDNVYLHNDIWVNSKCEKCTCKSGTMTCSKLKCPQPDCSGKSGKTTILPGQCCPICVEDQCKGTGLVYNKCSCNQTCDDYANKKLCGACSEGCFCPPYHVLKEGKCSSVLGCDCVYNGVTHVAGTYFSPSVSQFCMCEAGKVECINFNFG